MKRSHTIGSESSEDIIKGREIVEQAWMDWEARGIFRQKRARNRRYLRGRQWEDLMENPDNGEIMTEKKYLQSQGRLAAVNNQIAPILKNLVGQFRQNRPSPIAFGRNREDAKFGEDMTQALRYVLDVNQAGEVDVAQFREILMSGACGYKIEFGWWRNLNRDEVIVDPIDQTRLFYNSDLQDVRLKDLTRIGYLHDMEVNEIVEQFAQGKKDEARIRQIYAAHDQRQIEYNMYSGSDHVDALDFYTTPDTIKGRVIEAWQIEHRWVTFLHDPETGKNEPTEMSEEEVGILNRERVNHYEALGISNPPLLDIEERYEGMFKVYYLSPWGHILFEAESPYTHEEPPYSLTLYPLIDGECWGLVEDIIDQQRYINRMISMLDFLLGTSAKGVLMVPEDVVPAGMTEEEFGAKFAKFNGTIFYKPNNSGAIPQHITNNSTPAGLGDMLSLQMNLIEKISGVVGPQQGHTPSSGTPASLYAQQTMNASVTNKDIFDSFYAGLRKRNKKVIQVLQQFYDEPRYIKTSGKNSEAGLTKISPDQIRDVDYDVNMTEGQSTAVYRQMIDEALYGFVENKFITFEEYLEETSMPFADSLLEKLRTRTQQQQQAAGMTPEQAEASGVAAQQMMEQTNQPAQPQATPQ